MTKFLAHLLFWSALLVGGAGAIGAYFGYVLSIVGFGMVAAALVLAGVGFFISLIALFRSYSGKALLALFMLLELPCLALVAYAVWIGSQHPINDISTDTANVPKFIRPAFMATILSGQEHVRGIPELPRPYNPGFAAIQKSLYGGVATSTQKLPPEHAFAAVKQTVTEDFPDWRVVMEDAGALTLQAEAESSFFRFIDDIVVRVTPVEGDPALSRIDVRSRSRYGRSDYGKNAERVTKFLVQFRTKAQQFVSSNPMGAPKK